MYVEKSIGILELLTERWRAVLVILICVTVTPVAYTTKTTVFPAYYASMIRISIWVFVLVFPPTLSEEIGYEAIPV